MVVFTGNVTGYLGGLSDFLASLGSSTDAVVRPHIAAAEADIQRLTGTRLEPTVIKMNPADDAVYDMEEDTFDFQQRAWLGWPTFKTRWRPIISVERVAVEYGQDQGLISIPSTYVRMRKKTGRVSLVPSGAGAAVTVGSGYTLLTFLGGAHRQGLVPQMVAIDYTAGVREIGENPEYADLLECVAQEAAQRVLGAAMHGVSQGSTSISMDGLSESVDVSGLERRQKSLQDAVTLFIKGWNQTMRSPRMKVI